MKTKNIIIVAIVTLLVGLIIGLSVGYAYAKVTKLKGIALGTGTPTGFDGISIQGMRQGVPTSEFPVAPAANTVVGNGLATIVTSGSFAYSTTTLVAVLNPFGATSTVSQASIQGTNSTTTVDYLMGTSTCPSGITNASGATCAISATLINAQKVATTTQYFASAGVTVGPGTGYVTMGSGTFTEIVVGPKEYVVVLATSSYAGSSTLGNSGILFPTSTTTGTYVIEWQR
jgi:hypothetical protein